MVVENDYPIIQGIVKFDTPTLPEIRKIDRLTLEDSKKVEEEKKLQNSKILIVYGQHGPISSIETAIIDEFGESIIA